MKKALVIAGFPGVGKTYYKQTVGKEEDLVILDNGTGSFLWERDAEGKATKIPNKEFPENFINYIKQNMNKADIIFIGVHEEGRKALQEAGIEYSTITPLKSIKAEWINERIAGEDCSDVYLNAVTENWEAWIDSVMSDEYADQYIVEHVDKDIKSLVDSIARNTIEEQED